MNEALTKYILEEFGVEVSPDEDLLTSELIDSMGVMLLIDFIESELSYSVPQGDVTFENFQSVDTIVTYLTNNRLADP